MEDFKALISLWPTLGDFAEDIGVPVRTAAQMKWRNSLHSKYWKAACDGAARRNIANVTLQALADIAAKTGEAA